MKTAKKLEAFLSYQHVYDTFLLKFQSNTLVQHNQKILSIIAMCAISKKNGIPADIFNSINTWQQRKQHKLAFGLNACMLRKIRKRINQQTEIFAQETLISCAEPQTQQTSNMLGLFSCTAFYSVHFHLYQLKMRFIFTIFSISNIN